MNYTIFEKESERVGSSLSEQTFLSGTFLGGDCGFGFNEMLNYWVETMPAAYCRIEPIFIYSK